MTQKLYPAQDSVHAKRPTTTTMRGAFDCHGLAYSLGALSKIRDGTPRMLVRISPSRADVPTVWGQGQRPQAQWDGSFAASLAIVGAPYLHHGSVPTMRHLLVPCARAATFYRGNLDYDQRNMGFVWDRQMPETIVYDTSHRGQSNMGHVGAHYLGDLTGRPSPKSSRICPPI